ncbi:MAG: hypothetical protein R2741_10345 [Methanolobus sp.]
MMFIITSWDGMSWETPLLVETNVYKLTESVDVAHASFSGDGIIV